MINKIKEGYNLFIKKNDNKFKGTLTLKDNDIYKDIIELNDIDMVFLNEFSNIYNKIDEDSALSISYNEDKSRFVSSIKEKVNIGEYNDKIVWNDTLSNSGQDIIESLNNLNQHIVDDMERSFSK